MTDTQRTPTPIDQIAEAWVDTSAELSPGLATYIGRFEHNHRLDDLSPAGRAARLAAATSALASLREAEPVDDVDLVTKADLSGDLELEIALHEAGAHLRDVNVIASPAQELRNVFDLMPTDTIEDWSVIADRLAAVPAAIGGYVETLREGIATGVVPARRQVTEVIGQIARYTADNGFFATYAADAAPAEGGLPASLAKTLADHAGAARVAYDELADFLRTELAPAASETDAVGRELYQLHSRVFLGAEIDLDETYEWGLEELARMVAEREREPPGRDRRRGGGVPRERREPQAPRHRRASGVDAGDERPRRRGTREDALRHPRADPAPGVHDRPDQRGRHLLHRPDRRLLAPGPDVVVGAGGRRLVRHLA